MDLCIELDDKATGVWAKSGQGFCRECGSDLCEGDFAEFDYDGYITCDNCGKDTADPGCFNINIR